MVFDICIHRWPCGHRFRQFEAVCSCSGEDSWPVSKSTILPGPDGPSEMPDLLLGIARRRTWKDVKGKQDFYGLCGDSCGDSLSKWWGQLTKWTTCWWATKTGRHEYQCNRWIDCENMFQVIWRHCKDMQGLNSGIFWLQLVLQILSWI